MPVFHRLARRARPLGRRQRPALLLALVGLLLLAPLTSASAAGPSPFSTTFASVRVSGATVTVVGTFAAATTQTTQSFGVCMRSSSGANYDFSHVLNGSIAAGGTGYTRSRTVPAGLYQAYGCVKAAGVWHVTSAPTPVSVGQKVPTDQTPAACTVTPNPASTSAGALPLGNLPGWRQVLAEDFATPAAPGTFLTSPYAPRFFPYAGWRDTSGNGVYDPTRVLSVSDGALDMWVHTAAGSPRVAAVVPHRADGWGQTYGRFAFRFQTDTLSGYKFVGVLWPDSDNWGEGEVDFPEVNDLVSTEKIYANLYQRGNTSTRIPGADSRFTAPVPANASGWHTATIEWTPGCVTYWLDGVRLGTHDEGVPSTKLHLVLQVETVVSGRVPDPALAGHIRVDWVTIYERQA